jgi:hypothetical protein
MPAEINSGISRSRAPPTDRPRPSATSFGTVAGAVCGVSLPASSWASRDELRSLALNVAARQPAGIEHELGQRAPELAFEVEDRVQDVVAEADDAAVDVRRLAAARAVCAGQRGTAVWTRGVVARDLLHDRTCLRLDGVLATTAPVATSATASVSTVIVPRRDGLDDVVIDRLPQGSTVSRSPPVVDG